MSRYGRYASTIRVECTGCGRIKAVSSRGKTQLMMNNDAYGWTWTEQYRSLCPECSEEKGIESNYKPKE